MHVLSFYVYSILHNYCNINIVQTFQSILFYLLQAYSLIWISLVSLYGIQHVNVYNIYRTRWFGNDGEQAVHTFIYIIRKTWSVLSHFLEIIFIQRFKCHFSFNCFTSDVCKYITLCSLSFLIIITILIKDSEERLVLRGKYLSRQNFYQISLRATCHLTQLESIVIKNNCNSFRYFMFFLSLSTLYHIDYALGITLTISL